MELEASLLSVPVLLLGEHLVGLDGVGPEIGVHGDADAHDVAQLRRVVLRRVLNARVDLLS